tara:strand:+ start:485 stop:661 length:177 start_codon:yes stop_codon:yes gene_type:complete
MVSELDSEKSKKVAFQALCSISCPNEKTFTSKKIKKVIENFFMFLVLVSKIKKKIQTL